jgi:hypothetical protein
VRNEIFAIITVATGATEIREVGVRCLEVTDALLHSSVHAARGGDTKMLSMGCFFVCLQEKNYCFAKLSINSYSSKHLQRMMNIFHESIATKVYSSCFLSYFKVDLNCAF